MQISVKRDEGYTTYELAEGAYTLLEALQKIKHEIDNTLAFSSGCRSSVCGSCAMRVNEQEVLACSYKVQDGDRVEPLNNMPVVRDLVVDMDSALQKNANAKAWIESFAKMALNHEDEKVNEVQSDCILCGSCYSSCPVYAVNGEFLGPFALTRVWKYVSDKREIKPKTKIDTIQQNGIWDCTLCNNCTVVCPQNISSKADIEKLRAKSSQFGYIDPNFGSFGGGFGLGDGDPIF
ncbi:MAG: succinate dehydrogenase/fumarate reductase iron-sulfur subunit [Epsilonproteobacteria bacterium]|nr:succinate dehydrogenase/fumarate reductase iron-sulfur subunit [Campylobacterota bacterium]